MSSTTTDRPTPTNGRARPRPRPRLARPLVTGLSLTAFFGIVSLLGANAPGDAVAEVPLTNVAPSPVTVAAAPPPPPRKKIIIVRRIVPSAAPPARTVTRSPRRTSPAPAAAPAPARAARTPVTTQTRGS